MSHSFRCFAGHSAELFAGFVMRCYGYRLGPRRTRVCGGDVDWIAWDNETMILAEVRYRSQSLAAACSSVDHTKVKQLFRCAAALQARYHDEDIRIEIIALSWRPPWIAWYVLTQ